MSLQSRHRGGALLSTLAGVLVALALAAPAESQDPRAKASTSSLAGTHAKTPSDVTAAALGQERSYSSYGKPETIDASTSAAQAHKKRDLRSPDARDAAHHPRDTGSAFTPPLAGPPTWPMDPRPITPAPTAKTTDAGNGVDRTTIGLGVAGSLLAISGIAALNGRRSRRRQRLRATV